MKANVVTSIAVVATVALAQWPVFRTTGFVATASAAPLVQGLTQCPKCNKPVKLTDKYCSQGDCGARLLPPAPALDRIPTVKSKHSGHGDVPGEKVQVVAAEAVPRSLTSGAQAVRGLALNKDGSRVYFGSNSGETADILSVVTDRPLATVQKDITSISAEFDPDLSPVGGHIAYVAETQTDESTLVVRNLDTGNEITLLKVREKIWSPRFNHDGTKIVYVLKSGDRAPGDLYVIDAKGGTPKALTEGAANDEYPTWCPKGCHVAFESDRLGIQQIWSVDIATGKPLKISPEGEVQRRPQWSSQGYIVFESAFWIWAMSENGGVGQPISTLDVAGTFPRLSADGLTLAFQGQRSLGREVFATKLRALNLQSGTP